MAKPPPTPSPAQRRLAVITRLGRFGAPVAAGAILALIVIVSLVTVLLLGPALGDLSFLPLAGVGVAFTGAMAIWSARPVVLTATTLRIPSGLFKWEVVDLADLAGVGLRGRVFRDQEHLLPMIWDRLGRRRSLRLHLRGLAVASDWAEVTSGPLGRAVTAIYDATPAVQGPSGLLASHHFEKLPDEADPPGLPTPFWSPDGTPGVV